MTKTTMHGPLCACDTLAADHVVVDDKAHHDCGTVTRDWRCLTCLAEWTDEISFADAEQEMTEDHPLWL